MNRETIDFGIDLGTTNSSIAMWGIDGLVEVFKNDDQSHSTPSAVYESKTGKTYVGSRARDAMKVDYANVHIEFKQQMGRSTTYHFPHTGRSMRPEELSAEILKSLKADVRRRLQEDLRAAVITIPAAFDRSEIDATNRAAALAGFTASPLCLEPVAAALAYAHKNAVQDGLWLVFDFGGGTFDAAIVQLRDEEFQVVNHQGDNHLGGKLIDWAIADEILVPAFEREHRLTDFSRRNTDPRVQSAITRLKYSVEKAKIRLSLEDRTDISEEDIFTTPAGDKLSFEFELKRSDVNRMAEPHILRAVALCRKALQEKRLSPEHIGKLVLVGGPTQMPYFREVLADPKIGLGIPLDFSVDPMTVVAQGAAIFARTQKLPRAAAAAAAAGAAGGSVVPVELECDAVGADEEVLVAGRIRLGDGQTAAGHTIEFSKPGWRSGRIRISAEGAFMTHLLAQRGENVYTIEIFDPTGNGRSVSPDRLRYLRKAMFKEIPLTQTIAIELSDQSIDLMFEKNKPLPVERTRTYKQMTLVRQGDAGSVIRIPILEGSNARANRNSLIGFLQIGSTEIRRDVTPGTEIEFTLSVDTSQKLTATAYIATLNQEFTTTIDLEKPQVQAGVVRSDAEKELERANKMRERVSEMADDAVKAAWARVENERLIEEVEKALRFLDRGGDAPDVLLDALRRLQVGLDAVEELLEWPTLVAEAAKNRADAEELTRDKHAGEDDKATFARLCREHQQALNGRSSDLLRRVSLEFDTLCYTILYKIPGYWVSRFEYLASQRSLMTDPQLAGDLLAQGRRSIDKGDVEGLKSVVRQLRKLLPREQQGDNRSTVNLG
jgi:molecular chaperone DnaK